MIFPLEMVIFRSYVGLPEGTPISVVYKYTIIFFSYDIPILLCPMEKNKQFKLQLL